MASPLVKITKASGQQKSGRTSYKLGLPVAIGEVLYERDLWFEAELIADGILFRPMTQQPVVVADLPEWARAAA